MGTLCGSWQQLALLGLSHATLEMGLVPLLDAFPISQAVFGTPNTVGASSKVCLNEGKGRQGMGRASWSCAGR